MLALPLALQMAPVEHPKALLRLISRFCGGEWNEPQELPIPHDVISELLTSPIFGLPRVGVAGLVQLAFGILHVSTEHY